MKQIEVIINRWFESVKQQISEESVKNKSLTLSFCSISLPVMQIYCSASGLLLDNGYKLPAMALFRTISDLLIKFLWCLNTDDENETKTRLHRWEKTSVNEKLRLLENLLKSSRALEPADVEKLKQLKIISKKHAKNNPHQAMPPVTGKDGLFEQTSNVFGADVSAILYRQFCSAVHVDTSIFSGLMNNKQGTLTIQSDVSEGINELKKRCLNFAYMYFVILDKKAFIDIITIKKDYDALAAGAGSGYGQKKELRESS